jgi:hypothetical protein
MPHRHRERSEAIQDRKQDWIASSQELLAMTEYFRNVLKAFA